VSQPKLINQILLTAKQKGKKMEYKYNCSFCDDEVTCEIDENPDFNLKPNICHSCDVKREREHRTREGDTDERCDPIPFADWDDEKGNMKTFNNVAVSLGCCSKGLIVFGDTGKGKTRTMAHCAKVQVNKGTRVCWKDCSRLTEEFTWFENNMGAQVEKLKRRILACDILILDDLGKGKMTDFKAAQYFDIFDRLVKMEGKVKLWVTTNKTPDNLAHYFLDYGRPIAQRLSDLCELVEVEGGEG